MSGQVDILYFYSFAALGIFFIVITLWLQRRFYNDESKKHGSLLHAIEKAETDLKELTSELKNSSSAVQENENRLSELLDKERRSDEIQKVLKSNDELNLKILEKIKSNADSKDHSEKELHELKVEISNYNRIYNFIDYGIFEEPEYLFETSERFKAEIKRVREKQKALIKDKSAFDFPDEIEVMGSSKKGQSIIDGQLKMMLRTFNIECDFLLKKVSPSNFEPTLDRINKLADNLEKTAISLMCGISPKYVELKLQECSLQYQFKLKQADEQDEQRLIKEQMREELKVQREQEKAIAEAEKEEKMFLKLLEQAKDQLAKAKNEDEKELQDKIAVLEMQLQEAHAKEERAKSLAEQTRRGHVYIISNIGSFGENIYKIGLTRRLDPMDRVKELGDASVPFTFDVHAIIYFEDAPAMEAELHRRFRNHRVNAVNKRKEFFNVSLMEIRNQVREISGEEHNFQMTALAEQYYESLRLQGVEADVA